MTEKTALPDRLPPLSRDTLPADTAGLAQFLIGKIVVRALPSGLATGRIVETEAYLTGDAASHTFRGMTARNSVMFGPPGYAYVYLAYGVYYALNVSSGAIGVGEGVLIRAAEPLSGIEAMMLHRGDVPWRDLMRGPGRLAKALDIGRSLNGTDSVCARTVVAIRRRSGTSSVRHQHAHRHQARCPPPAPFLPEGKPPCERAGGPEPLSAVIASEAIQGKVTDVALHRHGGKAGLAMTVAFG